MGVYTYIHTSIHAYMHTCIHAYMHTCLHAYMHTCIHTYIHTYVHTNVPTYINTNIHTCMHTCTYTDTYIHVHSYMHAVFVVCVLDFCRCCCTSLSISPGQQDKLAYHCHYLVLLFSSLLLYIADTAHWCQQCRPRDVGVGAGGGPSSWRRCGPFP